MKRSAMVIFLILNLGLSMAQEREIFTLQHQESKGKTIVYKRAIEHDTLKKSYHVRDYFENGQIQMDAFYSASDKHIKEEYQCNYRSNTKQGPYKEWYQNGQIKYSGTFKNGLRSGFSESWYSNGQKEEEEHWLDGQLHGKATYWTRQGKLQCDLSFHHGMNENPRNVSYHYVSYTPKEYDADTSKVWPLIIYLHGGSDRGTDLKQLYSNGIPDQIYRGREFPFVIIAPQCPEHMRFSTDNWFGNFYKEVTTKYRIDTNRVYLTGVSLGGSGTWYVAARYSDKFAAIAPMSGFTSHLDFIDDNIDKLANMPIWAFHGTTDDVVPFEETERIIKQLEGRNRDLKFTVEPEVGHWINWMIYPNQELYDWFLEHDKRMKYN